MAISLRATGTWTELTADGTVGIPAGAAAGDRMYLFASWKTYTITASVTGWTELIETAAGGTTAAGNGTGTMKVGCWYKDHSGSESNPTLDFSASPNIAAAVITVMQKASGESWDTPVETSANIAAAINFSATGAANPGISGGDMVMCLCGFCDDTATMTRGATTAIAATGITWSANYVESPAAHHSTTTGFDMAADLGHRLAGSGTASAAPTTAGTQVAADQGTALWVRQRVTLIPVISQAQFRWRNDDGNETTATWPQLVNVAYGTLADATRKRLRITIDETNGADPATTIWKLQCRIGSGTWQDVNTSGTIVRPSASGNLADDATTTQQLSSGLGTFVGGRFDEVNGAQSTVDIGAGGVTEHEWSIQLYGDGEAITPGDTINFRVVKSDDSLLDTYAVTPSLTVGAVPRRAQVTWTELEVPAAPAAPTPNIGAAMSRYRKYGHLLRR